MSTRQGFVALAAVAALAAGCGDDPPDEATSRRLIEQTIDDWHRFTDLGNGEAACRLMTEDVQRTTLARTAKVARAIGRTPPGDCREMLTHPVGAEQVLDLSPDSAITSMRIDGKDATVRAYRFLELAGGRDLVPVRIRLRWEDGRWLLA